MTTVWFEDVPVATLQETDGIIELVYDPAWRARPAAFPVSLTMPLSRERHPQTAILPWLANLLPETNLVAIGQAIGVAPQDVLGLLLAIGRDTAGALAIGRPRTGADRFRVIERDRDLERIIDELPKKPFLVGEAGVSMSLAGAQEKLAVAIVDGRIAVPLDGTPSTHILKPDNRRLKGSVQNEAFCLTLARSIGLETASVTTGRAGSRSYLLVERYDRMATPRGIGRIHQEDFAQLLGVLPKDKYEFGGLGRRTGPGLQAIFAVAAEQLSPGARLGLLDRLVFNVIACNTDAHVKNYSILIGAGGTAKLAPLYDVLCGEVWPTITRSLPQAIAGKRDATALHGADWRAFATEVGLGATRTIERVEELCGAVEVRAGAARDLVAGLPAGGNAILDRVSRLVVKRAGRLRRQLSNSA